jgi:transaldolase/glucose-6-phosphate isomerase
MKTPSRAIQLIGPERLAPGLAQGFRAIEAGAVVRRIWDRDWTVWKPADKGISDRLDWLSAPAAALEEVPDMEVFAASVRGEGFGRAVVLGMGGSSLAPEVFARSFATAPGALELEILDTTEPEGVAAAAAKFDLLETLFLVSSKSGTTAELLALLSVFYDRALRELGRDRAGSRFVAITDPGTPLEKLAGELGFRCVYHGRPGIGGRFSALSAFGLLPAALKGIDLRRLLAPALAMAGECRLENPADNPGAWLGTVLGQAAAKGLDKLTFFVPPWLDPLAGWLEQLVAESTGKEGRGIVPVIERSAGPIESYGEDRLLIELGAAPERTPDPAVQALVDRGAPLVRLPLDDPYALAGHFFLWEFATAVAAHFLKINPFDQPDVESTKRKTREVLAAGVPLALTPGGAGGTGAALPGFLEQGREGDYIAILAFLPRRPAIEEGLSGLVDRLRKRTHLPVTLGFGPRYLHSTGQLHKGDGNRGLFLMLVPADLATMGIPTVPGIARPASDFAGLFRAQARGDGLALVEKGRRVLTLELASPIEAGIAGLSSSLG